MSRWTRTLGTTALVAATATLGVASASGVASQEDIGGVPAGPRLTTSLGRAAMFTLPALTPGDTARRCIRVDGIRRGADVRMFARVSGALARQLRVRIVEGAVDARTRSCEGFRPLAGSSPLFAGRLSEMPASYKSGLRLDGGRQGFSNVLVEVRLPSEARTEGLRAHADFIWETRSA